MIVNCDQTMGLLILSSKKMKGFCVLFENSKNVVSEVCCLAVVLGR